MRALRTPAACRLSTLMPLPRQIPRSWVGFTRREPTSTIPWCRPTDNSKYLNTLFDGTSNASGAIFLDSEDTAPGMVDQQTTIYGHHMNDGSMFNVISDTTDQATFDSIEYVYYITRDATYKLRSAGDQGR